MKCYNYVKKPFHFTKSIGLVLLWLTMLYVYHAQRRTNDLASAVDDNEHCIIKTKTTRIKDNIVMIDMTAFKESTLALVR